MDAKSKKYMSAETAKAIEDGKLSVRLTTEMVDNSYKVGMEFPIPDKIEFKPKTQSIDGTERSWLYLQCGDRQVSFSALARPKETDKKAWWKTAPENSVKPTDEEQPKEGKLWTDLTGQFSKFKYLGATVGDVGEALEEAVKNRKKKLVVLGINKWVIETRSGRMTLRAIGWGFK